MNLHHRCHAKNSRKLEKIIGFDNSKFKALNIGRECHNVKM